MLRHSREMTRHHRERIIRKKKKLLESLWTITGYTGPEGKLSKHSMHHHHCHICNDQSYDRARAKREMYEQFTHR